MKFFLETIDLEKLQFFNRSGGVCGISITSHLLSQIKDEEFFVKLKKILQKDTQNFICDIDISLDERNVAKELGEKKLPKPHEGTPEKLREMGRRYSIEEFAEKIKEIGQTNSKIFWPNGVFRLHAEEGSYIACRELASVNEKAKVQICMVCYSEGQLLRAANAGSAIIQIPVGILEKNSGNGTEITTNDGTILMNYPYLRSDVVVSDLNTPHDVLKAALIGVNAAIITPELYKEIGQSNLTENDIRKGMGAAKRGKAK